MDVEKVIKEIASYFPERIRPTLIRAVREHMSSIREITLRSELPVCIYCIGGKRYYLTDSGLTTERSTNNAIVTTSDEIHSVFMALCDYSVYSKQEEINRGFVTASGGVRVGLCGSGVIKDGITVNIKDITTLSFRIPREVKRCSKALLELTDPLRGMLICSPPSGGKTTLIRDMARVLSRKYRVTVIDERGELSALCDGKRGFDLGLSDVYMFVPKAEAVINSIRCLSPDIVICDELGDKSDIEAVSYALRCGVSFIATVHASSYDELVSRPAVRTLLDTNAFGYIAFLGDKESPGRVKRIYSMGDRHA